MLHQYAAMLEVYCIWTESNRVKTWRTLRKSFWHCYAQTIQVSIHISLQKAYWRSSDVTQRALIEH